MTEARTKGESKPLKNDPPRIVFSTTPAILDPDRRRAELPAGPGLQLRAGREHRAPHAEGRVPAPTTCALFDGWMTAPAATGPWSVAHTTPGGELDKVMESVSKSGAVDLLAFVDPKDPKSRPSLAKGPVPAIVVAIRAHRADRDAGGAQLRPHRRNPAPLRVEHDRPRLQVPRRPADLRARGRPLVPRRHRGRPLDVRARQGSAAGLREDPRREPEGEREGVGARHHRRPRRQ